MSTAVFPNALKGRGWNRQKTPQFSTVINRAADGSETRASQYQYPLFKWLFTYNYLDNRADSALDASPTDFETIEGFYLNRAGAFDSFLFSDPADYHAVGRKFGVSDGNNRTFPLGRYFGGSSSGFFLPIEYLDQTSGGTTIYKNGTPMVLNTDYVFSGTGNVDIFLLGTVPTAGTVFTWDGYYYHQVRFAQDEVEYSNFLYKLWELKQLELVSAR